MAFFAPARLSNVAANLLLLALSSTLVLTSCDSDDPKPGGVTTGGQAVFIVNEGKFLAGNAEISRFNKGSKTVDRALFTTANGTALGDVAQSMTIAGSKGYIVVNNSNRIAVVNMADLKQQAQLDSLKLPRYLVVRNNRGYVTEWVDFGVPGQVREIDLTTNKLTGTTFATGALPEQLLSTTGGLIVANSGGNTLSVIDPASGAIQTVPVPDAPTALRLDARGRVWVLCAGQLVYNASFTAIDTAASTAGSLVVFSPGTPTQQTKLTFHRRGVQPSDLQISPDGATLYYSYLGKVFAASTSAATLPTTALLRRAFYGLGIDPSDGTIYGGDARGFSGDGKVVRFQPTGTPIDSFSTAVGPSRFLFY